MDNKDLFKYAEKKANLFNLYCLLIIGVLGFIAMLLNEIGIFKLDRQTMRATMIQLAIYGSIPAIMFFIHDKLLRKNHSILEDSFFKWVIIAISFMEAIDMCTIFSFHGTVLLVIPPLIGAQYKHDKYISVISFVGSMVLTVIAVYGSFLFGQYDANLLKPLTEAEAESLKNRLNVLTPKRFGEIFLHYVLPLMLGLGAVDFIAFSITKRTAEMIDIQIELSNKVHDEVVAKTEMQNGVIEHLADIIESRDIETGEHIKRTKKYVAILVEKMKDMERYKDYLNPQMCEYIINAAPLHDIGKIAVSDLILCKPGRLTDEEFEKMKIHTVKGGEIIKDILNELGDESFLEVAYDVAISHHEKWNGKGYPYGLKEEEIPLPGRIMAVADVFDALVAKRVYKEPMPIDKAIDIIIGDAGIHFDPNIVEVFKLVLEDFKNAAVEEL